MLHTSTVPSLPPPLHTQWWDAFEIYGLKLKQGKSQSGAADPRSFVGSALLRTRAARRHFLSFRTLFNPLSEHRKAKFGHQQQLELGVEQQLKRRNVGNLKTKSPFRTVSPATLCLYAFSLLEFSHESRLRNR